MDSRQLFLTALSGGVLLLLGIGLWTWWKVRNLARGTARELAALRAGFSNQYWQLEALVGLYYDLRPSRALPRTRGMAASPDFLRVVCDLIEERKPQRILELGSGTSTLVIAMMLARNGAGHLWSLDHDPDYAELTKHLLAQHRFQEWGTIVHAPLSMVSVDDTPYRWYEPAAVPDGTFDLIVVDGPPEWTSADARYPTVPMLSRQVPVGGMIVLDDASRPGEERAIAAWLTAHEDLRLRRVPTEKGCAILERS